MKQANVSELAVALVEEALDLMERAERAPVSPMNTAIPRKLRREYRRKAARLRQGQLQPRYENLHTPEQLADIYERTIRRDEILEGVRRELHRVGLKLRRIIETNADEVHAAIHALIVATKQSMEKDGPGSDAARRYRLMQFMVWSGKQFTASKRRQKAPPPPGIPIMGDPYTSKRYEVSAAEILPEAPPPDEPVVVIPPDGSDFGHGRLFIRIGTGERRWTGDFARGVAPVCSIVLMPGDKHLLVAAGGAGYIIDVETHALVETIGTEVACVIQDECRSVFIVSHRNKVLEAFGPNGRLWKTETIGSGRFRGVVRTDTELLGEAWYAFPGEWVLFAVNLATGAVRTALGLGIWGLRRWMRHR
jgi:hypothetical protein